MPLQDISFEISGVKVKPDDAKNALEKALFQGVQEYIRQSVGSISCPVHGASTKIICKGHSLSDLGFKVSGCCKKFTNAVGEKLIN